MKPRKVGIPRVTPENIAEVVARVVEVVDELQGAVGTPDQRAVRLGELVRARLAQVNPHGELLLAPSDPAGTAAGTVGAHEAAADPHPQYLTAAEAAAAHAPLSHTHTPAEAGADPAGTAASTVGAHEAAADPHPQYRTPTFVHTQGSAATSWTVNHNLGFRPAVEVFSVGGAEIDAEVLHTSLNQTVISFNAATAGSARLT